jgi:hypothetical protein
VIVQNVTAVAEVAKFVALQPLSEYDTCELMLTILIDRLAALVLLGPGEPHEHSIVVVGF